MNTNNDGMLLKKMSQDDQESFAIFIRRNRKMVMRYALSMIQNKADAEDVFQESLISIRKGAPTFSSTNGKSWI